MESIYLPNYSDFSAKAKAFASQFNPCIILDSCGIQPQCNKGVYKLVLAWGGHIIENKANHTLDNLYQAWQESSGWVFGVLGYNLKNEIENLHSTNSSCFNWPAVECFMPKQVLTVSWDDKLTIHALTPMDLFDEIMGFCEVNPLPNRVIKNSSLISDFQEANHRDTIEKIKEQIRNGNVYELNLCSRFLFDKLKLSNPYRLYEELIKISPSPFSAYLALGNHCVLSASPERYMAKMGDELVSQPIKGTRPRSTDTSEDSQFKCDLAKATKDRAENVMIVDLVRNDMARVAQKGTVKVEELFGIYSYSHVHQMVSTVTCQLEKSLTWKDAIQASFPMGSMTGTPKIAAMQWIDHFEYSNREWYSGALGYIAPNGNMDFNVLIRSMFYDSQMQKLAYYAGGAITIDSNADDEYREMLVKAKAIDDVLNTLF